ncbi:MAG: hypothetical protein QM669_06740 [Siphonobacter sp.]
MKTSVAALFLYSSVCLAQTAPDNTFSVNVNGKEWAGKATRLRFPAGVARYVAIAGMSTKPDIQTWIRIYYTVTDLKPGTYPVYTEKGLDEAVDKQHGIGVFPLIDYSEETKGMGGAFHDGESTENGTLTITKVTDSGIEGTFEAKLKGVFYKKRVMATLNGSGLFGNMQDKAITGAGGGMLVKADPHDHDNCKKTNETDEITLTNGKFKVSWAKQP